MIRKPGRVRSSVALTLLALALVAGAGSPAASRAETPQQFWRIPLWALAGAWQDSTLLFPRKCEGVFAGPLPDSIREQASTVTVRFLRNRRVEARPDFGGYRIYRVQVTRDTTSLMLVRRYSVNRGDDALWHFSKVDTSSLQFLCGSDLASDSVITFVDPDSSGSLQKVCRRTDALGRCTSIGDSIWKLVAPPGPHDGFRTWYTVTYEARNTLENTFEDLFVPDTTDNLAHCPGGLLANCPDLNNKAANLMVNPVEPTPGPARNLGTVAVVPNPFRANEAWDRPGGNEIHFINLPSHARIRVYTVSGELVRELKHDDAVRDFERWDLKNADGRDVASGIYMYRVEAGSFSAQNRFIVIR